MGPVVRTSERQACKARECISLLDASATGLLPNHASRCCAENSTTTAAAGTFTVPAAKYCPCQGVVRAVGPSHDSGSSFNVSEAFNARSGEYCVSSLHCSRQSSQSSPSTPFSACIG